MLGKKKKKEFSVKVELDNKVNKIFFFWLVDDLIVGGIEKGDLNRGFLCLNSIVFDKI